MESNEPALLVVPEVEEIPYKLSASSPFERVIYIDVGWWNFTLAARVVETYYLQNVEHLVADLTKAVAAHKRMRDDPSYRPPWDNKGEYTPTKTHVIQGAAKPLLHEDAWHYLDRSTNYITMYTEHLVTRELVNHSIYIKLSEHDRILNQSAIAALHKVQSIADRINITPPRYRPRPFLPPPVDEDDFLKEEAKNKSLRDATVKLEVENRALQKNIKKLKDQVNDLKQVQALLVAEYPDLEQRLAAFRAVLDVSEGTSTPAPDEEPFEPDGYVYLVSIPSGVYKIGRTVKAKNERVKVFDTDYPEEPALEHMIPCRDYKKAEAQLHRMFNDKRIRKTEWFRLSVADVMMIKSIERM